MLSGFRFLHAMDFDGLQDFTSLWRSPSERDLCQQKFAFRQSLGVSELFEKRKGFRGPLLRVHQVSGIESRHGNDAQGSGLPARGSQQVKRRQCVLSSCSRGLEFQ